MTDRESDIASWQDKISLTFQGPSGTVGERLFLISDAERKHRGESTREFHGFMVLLDAFQDFAIQTVSEAKQHRQVMNVFAFSFVVATFRRLRVAMNEFYNGYYYDASSNLRSVLESVLYLGAVANGAIRFDAFSEAANRVDLTQLTESDRKKFERKVQIEIDGKIRRSMRGQDSGLSDDDQRELEEWFQLMHAHVHKSSSTVIEIICEIMTECRIPSIEPTLDRNRASIFCNSAVCASWAFLRVLPCLSLPSRFSEEWQRRFLVLDDSFRFYLEGWERPLSTAFLRFMELRMCFTEDSFKRFEVNRDTSKVVSISINH